MPEREPRPTAADFADPIKLYYQLYKSLKVQKMPVSWSVKSSDYKNPQHAAKHISKLSRQHTLDVANNKTVIRLRKRRMRVTSDNAVPCAATSPGFNSQVLEEHGRNPRLGRCMLISSKLGYAGRSSVTSGDDIVEFYSSLFLTSTLWALLKTLNRTRTSSTTAVAPHVATRLVCTRPLLLPRNMKGAFVYQVEGSRHFGAVTA